VKYFFATIWLTLFAALFISCQAQLLGPKKNEYTRQDTLRGSNGPARDWWNVVYYSLNVTPDYTAKTIRGSVDIYFDIEKKGKDKIMQIDLQEPMQIDSIKMGFTRNIKKYWREGNVFFIDFENKDFTMWLLDNKLKGNYAITIYFSGKPRQAVTPPWDGGWIWTKDEKGRPWMSVACQGLGASVWYPCKDYQGDEPDNGATLSITVPDTLTAVGNGKFLNKESHQNGTATWYWGVKSPINNYNIIPYIGHYVNWSEKYNGEKGDLDCSYWVMDYNLEKSKKQFGRDVKPMMKCFEYWFGPYPFYEDSYKLVEAPHLGMEHQSAVAYGNKYKDGYLGIDLSGSGWGSKWDYIIVHESGHEWFGNNITTRDIADMWVHEGFTDYSEALFVECQYGKQAADEYVQGLRKNIENDRPVIGPYGVNREGSGDMYFKGANMLHTIRQVIADDSLFRRLLRGLNRDFYHQVVTTAMIENYLSKKSGKNLAKIFDQYLRTNQVPVLEYKIKGRQVSYRWTGCVPGFNMPVLVSFGGAGQWISPAEKWQVLQASNGQDSNSFAVNPNFYITSKRVE
jgi:aminopeptidase N